MIEGVEFSTQGFGAFFVIVMLFVFYKTRKKIFLYPILILTVGVFVWNPIKTTVKPISVIEGYEKPVIVLPKKVGSDELTLEQEQDKLTKKVSK